MTPEETPVRKQGTPLRDDEKSIEGEKVEEVDGDRPTVRATSTPPPYDPTSIIIRGMQIRPLSICSMNENVESSGSLTGSGSERSIAQTPQQRRVRENLSNSPSARPRVSKHTLVWHHS